MKLPIIIAVVVFAIAVAYLLKTTIGFVRFSGRVLMWSLLAVALVAAASIIRNEGGGTGINWLPNLKIQTEKR